MPSVALPVALQVALAVAAYLGVRVAARRLDRRTPTDPETAARLQTLRFAGYLLAVVATAGLDAGLGTVRAVATAIPAPVPPVGRVVVAWAGLLLGPLLAVRLGTLSEQAVAEHVVLTNRDIAGWFATRYATGALALVLATVVVTAVDTAVGRVAVAATLVTLIACASPVAISFTVRDRPATAAECERAGVPSDIRLRIVDDRTRFGIAFAAGVLPGLRVVYVTERLVASLPEPELRAVVAHEVGHHRLHHVGVRHGLLLPLLAPPLVALEMVTRLDGMGTLVLGESMVLSALSLLVVFAVIRRTEHAADAYAARQVGGPVLASALQRLAAQRLLLSTPGPHAGPLAAHPTLQGRLTRLTASEQRERSRATS